jgi:Putative DNA-binding domain
MLPDLDAFQDAFASALDDPDAVPELAALTTQPGFRVYRNTITSGCIDALRANYLAVARLVGAAWFDAAAAIYFKQQPPRQPMLCGYGDGFADFLADFEPARSVPYLAAVAAIERLWTESHLAGDDTALPARLVARLSPTQLAGAVLVPHVSARWRWFDTHPAYSLWLANRQDDPDLATPDWHGEGVLLVRPQDSVVSTAIDPAGCAFLDACAAGSNLTAASHAALDAAPNVDLSALMRQLLEAGSFSANSLTEGRTA